MTVRGRCARCGILPFALVVLSLLPLVSRAQEAPATQPAAVTDEAFDAALAKAAAAKTGSPEFVAAMQSVAPRFAALEPAAEPDNVAWHAVSLNGRGKRFDAIRFRVPEGKPRDLLWAVAFPAAMKQWFILPAEGKPGQGFRSFKKAQLPELFGDTAPPDVTGGLIQTLEGKNLQPGKEYLLWFEFKDEKPATLYATLALLPTVGNPNANTAVKGLKLPRPYAAPAAP